MEAEPMPCSNDCEVVCSADGGPRTRLQRSLLVGEEAKRNSEMITTKTMNRNKEKLERKPSLTALRSRYPAQNARASRVPHRARNGVQAMVWRPANDQARNTICLKITICAVMSVAFRLRNFQRGSQFSVKKSFCTSPFTGLPS